MSAFDAPTTENQTTQTETTVEDWVKEVVSEKGEQWQDPQVLAKGYFHSQARIKELEAAVEKSKEQDYAKQLLEQLQAKQEPSATPPATPEPNPSSSETKEDTTLSAEDIENLLNDRLNTRERMLKVETELSNRFGDAANTVVHSRAKELGLSIDRMKELAVESPSAFLRLVGEPAKQETNTLPTNTKNTAGFDSKGNVRDSNYYRNLRRENRNLYHSPAIQKQLLQDRLELGDKF